MHELRIVSPLEDGPAHRFWPREGENTARQEDNRAQAKHDFGGSRMRVFARIRQSVPIQMVVLELRTGMERTHRESKSAMNVDCSAVGQVADAGGEKLEAIYPQA